MKLSRKDFLSGLDASGVVQNGTMQLCLTSLFSDDVSRNDVSRKLALDYMGRRRFRARAWRAWSFRPTIPRLNVV